MTSAQHGGPPLPQESRSDFIEQRISVPFDYRVYFVRDAFAPAHPLLESVIREKEPAQRHRVMAFVDSGVSDATPGLTGRIAAYLGSRAPGIELAAPPAVVAGGESAKIGWDGVESVIRQIAQRRLDRHSYVVAVGGGGTLDVVGLAASLVHRGLRLIRVPTTVVAQNDVGVGVKNGIDAYGAKNFLGTFAPPHAVINDFDFLRTLSDRDWIGGVAEAFKVAIIRDAAFFGVLCRDAARYRARDEAAMEALVRRCAELHLDHIRTSGDPFEAGSARPLDFGHWAAHKLEVMSEYRLTHGCAVAIGIALDSVYAERRGLLTAEERDRILDGLASCGLSCWDPLLEARGADGRLAVLTGLDQFREHLGGELAVTLPRSIGQRVEVHEMLAADIEASVAFLRRR